MTEQKHHWSAHERKVGGKTIRVKGHDRDAAGGWQQQVGPKLAAAGRAVRDNPRMRRLAIQTSATVAASGMALLILGEAAATLVMTVGLTLITVLNGINVALGRINEQQQKTVKRQQARRTRARHTSSTRTAGGRRTASSRTRTNASTRATGGQRQRTAGTKSTSRTKSTGRRR